MKKLNLKLDEIYKYNKLTAKWLKVNKRAIQQTEKKVNEIIDALQHFEKRVFIKTQI
jgi:hypothetical protein